MKFTLIVLLATAAVLATAGTPNILISDDRGCADVVFRGSKQPATPHLDNPMMSGLPLANNGTIETQHNHEP